MHLGCAEFELELVSRGPFEVTTVDLPVSYWNKCYTRVIISRATGRIHVDLLATSSRASLVVEVLL